jgi:hypothetical protein
MVIPQFPVFLKMFDFVAANEDISIMRSRTNFYASLMRLLNIELEEDISIFDQFMGPITGTHPELAYCIHRHIPPSLPEKFKGIYGVFQSGSVISPVNEPQLRMAIIGKKIEIKIRNLKKKSQKCTP